MEKRSIFEKLGLVEKTDNDSGKENEYVLDKTEQDKLVELGKKRLSNNATKVDVNEEINRINEFEDPVAMVKKKKLLDIEEIYKNYDIDTQGINSLSIVESFQKALPDYLPIDIKRQSILNIIASSNVKVENLVKDGNDKLKCLKDFSQLFSNESSDVISKFDNEIKKLNDKINNYNKAIENMKNLQTEQDFSVKYEIEKINNILKFIDYEK